MRSELKEYFDELEWTVVPERLNRPALSPYSIDDNVTASFFGDTVGADDIFPVLDGIGILDYRSVSLSLLKKIQDLVPKIKNSTIKIEDCNAEKHYLPALLNFRFKKLQPITAVYYGRPHADDKGDTVVTVRIESKQDNKNVFRIVVIHFEETKGRWLISHVDFKGLANECVLESN